MRRRVQKLKRLHKTYFVNVSRDRDIAKTGVWRSSDTGRIYGRYRIGDMKSIRSKRK